MHGQKNNKLKAVIDIHTFLWGKVFDTKRAGRNNNNSGLKGFANFEIAKSLIFVNINLYHPYSFSFLVIFGRSYKAFLQSAVWRNSTKW